MPAEPRLRAAAEHLLSRGISGADLAALEDGWLLQRSLEHRLSRPDRRSRREIFRLGGRLLSTDDDRLADAGALAVLVSVGRRGLPDSAEPGEGS